MLEVKNLFAEVDQKKILSGVNLTLPAGEVHILMGSNGSGKSTLARTLMGHPEVTVTKGVVILDGKDITSNEPQERSQSGLFVAYQYPIEIPGVNFSNFLRLAYNAHRPKEQQIPVFKFRKLLREKAALLKISDDFLQKNLNEGMSGGERKKAEILQMAVLEPRYAILDETDSGLDVDALKTVFSGIEQIRKLLPQLSILVITHYERIFSYISPNKVHVMANGKIIKTGGLDLVEYILKEGYEQL